MSKTGGTRTSPIYLVGMMGAGKSTVGVLLAEQLGCAFVDTDAEVEARAACTIAEIFEREGEARFRALEAEAIEAATEAGAVVALGGGAMAQPGMADRLCERGDVVWLRLTPEESLERVGTTDDRPLLAGLDRAGRLAKLEALLSERQPYYSRAQHRVDAGRAPDEVVRAIVASLEGDDSDHEDDGSDGG